MTARVFVYGTLMPAEDAWPVLARWSTGEYRTDAVPGALYDTGRGYPCATFATAAPGLVHGVVVELDRGRLDAAFAALDRYEASEYDRIVVTTAGGIEAATYAWVASLAGCRTLTTGHWPEPETS